MNMHDLLNSYMIHLLILRAFEHLCMEQNCSPRFDQGIQQLKYSDILIHGRQEFQCLLEQYLLQLIFQFANIHHSMIQ